MPTTPRALQLLSGPDLVSQAVFWWALLGPVKHIISVSLHGLMQNTRVIAAESELSKHCYCNVSIRRSQQKVLRYFGPRTRFPVGSGGAWAAAYLFPSPIFFMGAGTS